MRRTRNGFTNKQYAYAKKRLGGDNDTKRGTALAVGYAPSVANVATHHIEQTEGFDNAMAMLASESGNLMMQIYHQLKNKDLEKESVSTLLNAVTVVSQAWERFTPKQKDTENTGNKLRSIVLNRIEHQTINAPVKDKDIKDTDKGQPDEQDF